MNAPQLGHAVLATVSGKREFSNCAPEIIGYFSPRIRASASLVVNVKTHCTQQHQTLDNLLVVDPDAEDRHAIVHHANDQCADHRSGHIEGCNESDILLCQRQCPGIAQHRADGTDDGDLQQRVAHERYVAADLEELGIAIADRPGAATTGDAALAFEFARAFREDFDEIVKIDCGDRTVAALAGDVTFQLGLRLDGDLEAKNSQHGILCEPARGGGSHYKVGHNMMTEKLTIPYKRPIKPIYIRKLIAFVEAVRALT